MCSNDIFNYIFASCDGLASLYSLPTYLTVASPQMTAS